MGGTVEKLSMPKNEEGKAKGFAFITFTTSEAVQKALKYDGDEYGGRRLKVNLAGQKGEKGDKGKGKGEKGKSKGNNELTAFVRGLAWSLTEEVIKKDFLECGEIERLRLPLNEEGKPKGIAFIEFKTKEGFEKALEFNEQEYGGRTIYVSKADGGKGKDGEKGEKG